MRNRDRKMEWLLLGGVFLLIVILPALSGFQGQIPSTVLKVCIYAILALGLNVVVGYTGLLDLGYVTFMATGAVVTAAAMVAVADPDTGRMVIPVGGREVKGAQHLFHFPGSYLAVLLFAGVLCAGIGVLRGLPTLHLTGDYYAIVTLGVAEIVYIWYRMVSWTGGPKSLWFNDPDVPTLFGQKLSYNGPSYYFLVVAVVAFTVVVSIHLRDSRVGRALAAIRLDTTAAMSCGVHVAHYKLVAFAVSGFVGGIGGSLFALWSNGFSAIGLEVWESILLVCCLVLGGMGSIRGALLGAAILVFLGEILRQKMPNLSFESGLYWEAWPQEARFLFYGIILVLLMRFRPSGLLPERVAPEPLPPEVTEAWRRAETPLFKIGLAEEHPREGSQKRALLRIQNLGRDFGGVKAVRDLSLTVDQGQIAALIGPNGAGKTTVFNGVTSVFTPTSGNVYFRLEGGEEASITRCRPDQICEAGIARTFQNIRLFKDLTVLENVKLGLHRHTHSGLAAALLRLPLARREESEVEGAAWRYLEFVGLERRAHELASSLDYGAQRKLEVARALATQPRLLLLDEPAAGMNPQETEDLMLLIRRIRDAGITLFLIEHDMKVVMGISDQVHVMEDGELIAQGTPAEIQSNPKVIEAYLGG